MNQNPTTPIQITQTWQVTGCNMLTIYPKYANSYITVMESAPDSNNRLMGFFQSWWDTRPCKHCKKLFSKHLEYTRGCGDCEEDLRLAWKTMYEPMDNLTYVEWLAEKRKVA